MKIRNLLFGAFMLTMALPASAQWTNYNTTSTINGLFGIANSAIQSAERKKAMEIQARQKVEFEQSFRDALAEAKDLEAAEDWEEALQKYEEASNLNCLYGYTDQKSLTRSINNLYVKTGRTADGPSILNNATTILPDYSAYRYVRENPVYVNKKSTAARILRVACSDKETRIEMEYESGVMNGRAYISGRSYIKGNKGGKLQLAGVENITLSPTKTIIPWPGQKLRFALIFPALPDNATEFDFIEPSTTWQYKDIKCR